MKHFPDFMKNPKNKIDPSQQNTDDVEGYYYEGKNESQIAFWECYSDRKGKRHTHDFDEYIACVSGEYIIFTDGKKIVLKAGNELYIPKGTERWEECKAGTRIICAFGGRRIKINEIK